MTITLFLPTASGSAPVLPTPARLEYDPTHAIPVDTGATYDLANMLRAGEYPLGPLTTNTRGLWAVNNDTVYLSTLNNAVLKFQTPVASAWSMSQIDQGECRDETASSNNKGWIALNSTRTKMWSSDNSNDQIVEYDLVEADNTYNRTEVARVDLPGISVVQGIFVTPDGSKLLLCDGTTDDVFEFTLNTNGTIADGITQVDSFAAAEVGTTLNGLAFNDTGLKMYLFTSSAAYQYSLPTAHTLAGATYDTVTLSNPGNESQLQGMAWSGDGKTLFSTGTNRDSLVYSRAGRRSTTLVGTSPNDMAWQSDGMRFFVNRLTAGVETWSCASPHDVSNITQVGSAVSVTGNLYGMWLHSAGTRVWFSRISTSPGIYQYDLTTPNDFQTLANQVVASTSTEQTSPSGITFNPDYSKVWVVGLDETIDEYNVTTPGDVTGGIVHVATFTFDTTTIDNPRSLRWSTDGLRLNVTSVQDDEISILWCTSAFDLSTFTRKTGFDTSGFFGTPACFAWRDAYGLDIMGTDRIIHQLEVPVF